VDRDRADELLWTYCRAAYDRWHFPVLEVETGWEEREDVCLWQVEMDVGGCVSRCRGAGQQRL